MLWSSGSQRFLVSDGGAPTAGSGFHGVLSCVVTVQTGEQDRPGPSSSHVPPFPAVSCNSLTYHTPLV